MKSKTFAVWSMSLDTECPNCEHDFDILDIDDIWGIGFEPIEHGTKATKNFEVTCPKCGGEFLVDFEY